MQNTNNTTLPLKEQMRKGIEELQKRFNMINQIKDIIRLTINGLIFTFYQNKEGAIKHCTQLREDLLNNPCVDNITVNEPDLLKDGTTQEEMVKFIMNDQEIPVTIGTQYEKTTLTKLFKTRSQRDLNIPSRMSMLKEHLKNNECLQINLPNNTFYCVFFDKNRGRFFCKYLLDINVFVDIIVDTNGKCTGIELPDIATLTDDNLKEKLSTFISSVNQYFQEHDIDLFNLSDLWQVIYSPNTEISKNYSNVKQYFENKNKIQNEIIRRRNSVLSSNNKFVFPTPAGYSCLTNKNYPSIQDISQALKSYKTYIQDLKEKYLKAIDISVEEIKKLQNISDIEVKQYKDSLSDVLNGQTISLDNSKFLFYTLSDNIVEMRLTDDRSEKLILKLDKNFDVEYLEYKNDNTKKTAKIYPNIPFYYKNKQHYLNNMCMFHNESLCEINNDDGAYVNDVPDQIKEYNEFKSIQKQQMLWQRLLQNWNISSANCVALNKNFKFNDLLKKIIINNALGISVKEFNEILQEKFKANTNEEKMTILATKSKELKQMLWQRLLQNWNISSANCVALNKNFKFNDLLKKIIINNTLGISVKEFNEILKEKFKAKTNKEKMAILATKSKELKQKIEQQKIKKIKDTIKQDKKFNSTTISKMFPQKNIVERIKPKTPLQKVMYSITTTQANNKNR